ncbi:hypothetical protein DKM44_14590 [Deinococcus irradiatisoli]|uniref:Uncharacterized protein n=2 Tax=Deinococcus irradiatisoli TaxID=2202254 RepID=A0A2Z3JUV7_9DEIO|nr:hypothetical protein DKM44_14590 [Deinococcus irradiatisoli]
MKNMDMATPTQDRTERLFKFLQEFTLLKFKPQRTSDNDTLLWLHSLPQEKEVFNAARPPAGRESNPDEWLVIRKPRFHLAPGLPGELQP